MSKNIDEVIGMAWSDKVSFEEIKKRTAIWKKEHYEGADSKWLKGNPLIAQSQLK